MPTIKLKLLLNLENFTSHCLKNPEILLVLLIGPLLIRPYYVYIHLQGGLLIEFGFDYIILISFLQWFTIYNYFFLYKLRKVRSYVYSAVKHKPRATTINQLQE